MAKVVYHEAAEAELLHEVGFLEYRANGLGRRFWVEIRRVVALLAEHPESGREIRDGIRKWHLRKFRYAIIYSRLDAHILILAVAHNSRRPDYWMDRSEER